VQLHDDVFDQVTDRAQHCQAQPAVALVS
jgi:hypothetical protein